MSIIRHVAAAAAALFFAGTAPAAVVTYNFSGTMGSSGVAGTNSTFTGSFSYDTDGPQSSQVPGFSQYRAGLSLSLTSGSFSTTFTSQVGASTSRVEVGDNYGSSDSFFEGITGPDFSQMYVYFVDPTQQAFSSTALPSGLSLSSFSGQRSVYVSTGASSLIGTITEISPAAVPEPASWAMMVGGFALVGGALRRRRPATIRFG